MANIQKIAKFVPVGTILHLTLNNKEEVQGTVLEYDETTIVLETPNGIEGIDGSLISRYVAPKEKPTVNNAISVPVPENRQNPVEKKEPKTQLSVKAVKPDFSVLLNKFAKKPEFAFPPIDFEIEIEDPLFKNNKSVIQKYYTLKDRSNLSFYKDLLKYRAENLHNGALYFFAGLLSGYLGDEQEAESMLKYSIQLGYKASSYALAAVEFKLNDYENTIRHLLMSIPTRTSSQINDSVEVIGYCIAKLEKPSSFPLGDLLKSNVLTRRNQKLVWNIIAYLVHEDPKALDAAQKQNLSLLRQTKTGNNLFSWEEEMKPKLTSNQVVELFNIGPDMEAHNHFHAPYVYYGEYDTEFDVDMLYQTQYGSHRTKEDFKKAKEAEMRNRLDEAEFYYLKSQCNGGNPIATVKLADIYLRQNKADEALKLYEKDPHAFRDYYSDGGLKVAILYAKAGIYRKSISTLFSGGETASPRCKNAKLLLTLYCYLALGDDVRLKKTLDSHKYDETNDELNRIFRKYQKKITKAQRGEISKQELWEEFIEPNFSSLASWKLSTCKYEGIKSRLRNSVSFSESDFNAVHRLYKQIKSTHPGERCIYILTLAKLAIDLYMPLENVYRYMQEYFIAMAESVIYSQKNYSPLVVRYYIAEALKLAKYNSLIPTAKKAWIIYIATFIFTKLSEIATMLINMENYDKVLESELTYLSKKLNLWNEFSINTGKICRESPWLEQILEGKLRNGLNLSDISNCENPENIEQESIFDAFKQLDSISIEKIEKIQQLFSTDLFQSEDSLRLKKVMEVLNLLKEYANQNQFTAKENKYLLAIDSIEKSYNEYLSFPTEISFEKICPVLELLRKILIRDFEEICNQIPKHSLSNMLDFYPINKDGSITAKLLLESLSPSLPPISDINISINGKNRSFKEVSFPDTFTDEKLDFEFHFTPTAQELADNAIALEFIVRYKMRNEKIRTEIFPISIRIGKQATEEIQNPYFRYASGQAVAEADTQMFFGRDELVKEISRELNVKYAGRCYVLYGQKRSGKTSVLRKIGQNIAKDTLYTLLSLQEVNSDGTQTLDCLVEAILDQVQEDLADKFQLELPDFPPSQSPILQLKRISRFLQQHQLGWVVGLDEFTYIYANKKEDTERFMHAWKSIMESKLFNAMLIGQDTMPAFRKEYPNDFCITNDKRISFLNKESTFRMATEPIPNGKERFKGDSLEKVFQFTNGSPFYLQKLCNEIVEYMNSNRLPAVTGADIENITDYMVEKVLKEEMFDSLVNAGDGSCNVSKDLLWKILATIAKSNDMGECQREDLASISGGDEAVQDLIDRGTLEYKYGRVKILVGLFTRWLKVNR